MMLRLICLAFCKIKKNKRGYTLLEYCAGAAIIAGIVWGAMNTLGVSMQTFLLNLGEWMTDRNEEIMLPPSS